MGEEKIQFQRGLICIDAIVDREKREECNEGKLRKSREID